MHRNPTSPSGFTLIELLVALAVFSVIIALTAKPVKDVIEAVVRTREEAEAITRNLAFLEILAKDIRNADRIEHADHGLIELKTTSDSTNISWIINEHEAVRSTEKSRTTLQISVTNLKISTRENDPTTRHIILRGNFAAIGEIERGFARRINTDRTSHSE